MKKLVVFSGVICIGIFICSAYILLSEKKSSDNLSEEFMESKYNGTHWVINLMNQLSKESPDVKNTTSDAPLNEEEFKKELEEVMADDIWEVLLTVKYRFYQYEYIPEFNDNIKKLENTEITLKGYMYPLSEHDEQDFFILSYYPIAQCFFCGGAGPESVMEINAKTPIKLKQKAVTIKGKLKLNSDDPERLFFILLDAEEI